MILSVFASSVMLAFAAIFHMIGNELDITIVMVAGQDFEVRISGACTHISILTLNPQERVRNHRMQSACHRNIRVSLLSA